MKLTIEPTADFEMVEGQPHRIWDGTDKNGTPVKLWVRMIQPQTHDPQLLADFDAALDYMPDMDEYTVTVDHRAIAISS